MAQPGLHIENNEDSEEEPEDEEDEEEEEPEDEEDEEEKAPNENSDADSADESEDDRDWVKPDYGDKEWLKKNCLSCQICYHTYDSPGDALNCFNGHEEKYYRCHLCFTLVKNDDNGMKRLFQHYQQRHVMGNHEETLKCPYCDESVEYKSITVHALYKHWSEALGK